jgi:hypothetical protein
MDEVVCIGVGDWRWIVMHSRGSFYNQWTWSMGSLLAVYINGVSDWWDIFNMFESWIWPVRWKSWSKCRQFGRWCIIWIKMLPSGLGWIPMMCSASNARGPHSLEWGIQVPNLCVWESLAMTAQHEPLSEWTIRDHHVHKINVNGLKKKKKQ